VPSAVAAFAGHADRILVDAPCSGTGSWRRRPEARWALAADGLEALVATQDRLLAQAASWLRPGARLVYATCSLLRQENEARVDALLAADPGLERVRLVEILGGVAARPIADATGTNLSLRPDRHGTDGFFAAVLRRKRS
jgi:16S rRNA (cytosine967-C5)-methyltransferase